MFNKKVLYNVSFIRHGKVIEDGAIITRGERIEKILEQYTIDMFDSEECIDMKGLNIYPAWIDSHLHMPGRVLFDKYGVILSSEYTVDDCIKCIEEKMPKDRWIRGYGWNPYYINNNLNELYEKLSSTYPDRPVILFSEDYHTCICNKVALNEISNSGVSINPNIDGTLKMKDIFALSNELPSMTFSEEDIRDAILEYQDFLLDRGITTIQTLMFIGGNFDREWKVLYNMDCSGELKLKVNIALTVQPLDGVLNSIDKFSALKAYETEHIKLNTVKLYVDGVVEGGTACISEPYEDTNYCEYLKWEDTTLRLLCRDVDSKGLQVHIHAIGNTAVHQAVEALAFAMDDNNTKGERRHVITHMQLADNADIEKMGEYGIIASLQPYWFPQTEPYYPLDYEMLGERANECYKAGSFDKAGVMITASSDNPVTPDPNPIMGINMFINHYRLGERISFDKACDAFTVSGAYQLFREKELGLIEEGYYADIIGFDVRLDESTIRNAKLKFVMVNGEVYK